MSVMESNVRTINCQIWCAVVLLLVVVEVVTLSGSNVCVVKQKYNITKRVKYRAPMSVRTYEWCFSMPPRCSRWDTEMRDLTRLETEERTAEVSVCCPGYKMQDISCVPICPNGKTGTSCSEGCPPNKWGPNCVHDCKNCSNRGACSPVTGECVCQEGWQGESCQTSMSTTISTTTMRELLTTPKTTQVSTTKTTVILTPTSTTSSTTILPTKIPVPSDTITRTPKVETTTPSISTTKKSIITTETSIATTKHSTTVQSLFTTVLPATEVVTNTFIVANNATYNRTEPTANLNKGIFTETTTLGNRISNTFFNTSLSTSSSTSTFAPTTTRSTKGTTAVTETTRKPETTVKAHPTTLKFKPKEIWIRPAQKGETPILEIKTLQNHESHTKIKPVTKKEFALETTTPKTIIVSIIPTSVSYATFRKIALSTASYVALKNATAVRAYNQPIEVTNSMSIPTSTSTSAKLNTLPLKQFTVNPSFSVDVTKAHDSTSAPTRGHSSTKSIFVNNKTNSMTSTSVVRMNTSNSLTMSSSTNSPTTLHGTSFKKYVASFTTSTLKTLFNETEQRTLQYFTTNRNIESKQENITHSPRESVTLSKAKNEVIEKTNVTKQNASSVVKTKSKTNTVTARPGEGEETFHILTEPEHITAVMGEKGTDRSSVDLISVISIAGGIMMAVITVAVVIVMIERCKRPRYEDVRKINDIRMQVMIDNNDVPPPYVRSIFHTPLPDPPNADKCHYQPISTLDRNLKQFMRPVVVQTISPMMLENFRGILECHYDHLPQRSQDFGTLPARFPPAPSMPNGSELRAPRAMSVTESTIEALKCEAELDVIDNTTSEPLYAEIPCWRPPSEHAIEIINMSGEAVTEL